jgi:hypothetical protein
VITTVAPLRRKAFGGGTGVVDVAVVADLALAFVVAHSPN